MESQHSESQERGCIQLTWRTSQGLAWSSWTLRSWGAVCLNRLGRLEVVPQMLREAWAVTLCHMPHDGARLPPPGTFPPL